MQSIAMLLGTLTLAVFLGVPRPASAAVAITPGDPPAESANPFVLMHAQDPVQWHAWTPETLALARREGRAILLSIGFSACFWCDAMERETFTDPGVASLMNGWFINVLVDREQRPDLDRTYGLAARVLGAPAGWPNNVFLTPDLQPFAASGYLPKDDDAYGQTGFVSLLKRVHEDWTDDPEAARAVAARTIERMRAGSAAPAPSPAATAPVDIPAWQATARERLLARIDWKKGGFATGAGKEPEAPSLGLLLELVAARPDPQVEQALRITLDAMAAGGVRDQLGGGFHRYSVDDSWSIPHFETMLTDNAQLLALYARAADLLHARFYARIAESAADMIDHALSAPDGCFFTSRGSQIDGVEGAPYWWSRPEIEAVLGREETARFLAVYAIASDSPAGDGVERGVLRLRMPLAQTASRAGFPEPAAMLDAFAADRGKLEAARTAAPQPAADHKIVASANGLAIAALAQAGPAMRHADYVASVRLAGERIWSTCWNAEQALLCHAANGGTPEPGYLEDYALLGEGYLALGAATGETVWRERAASLADALLRRFGRPDGGLASAPEAVLLPAVDAADRAEPSGTSGALGLLLGLSQEGENARYAEAAARLMLGQLAGAIAARPEAWPAALSILGREQPTLARALAQYPLTPAPVAQVPGLDTSDHAHVTVRVSRPAGQAHVTLVVTVAIEDGYHVNANPASSENLVPTSLRLDSGPAVTISYPPPHRFAPRFAPGGLDVYEGTVRIEAELAADALPPGTTLDGTIEMQACNTQTCLLPSTVPVRFEG
jgi:uncharacterized protein